jgi:hypothetical protein
MRRFTTSAGTDRRRLAVLLLAELICALLLVGRPAASSPPVAAPQARPAVSPAPVGLSSVASTPLTLRDGRNVDLIGMGGQQTAPLLARIGREMADATEAVTAFWGPDWRRDIVVVAAGSDSQFRMLAGGGSDIAAATTADRMVFAPGASAMSDASLRIVVRHELFHYAARAETAADAPRWLTEGVADFVGRPPTPPPPGAVAHLPTDTELDTAGPVRSSAYNRAWWFARFVADRYGAPALRGLYVRACGPGHADVAVALREALGAGQDEVLSQWRQWLAG